MKADTVYKPQHMMVISEHIRLAINSDMPVVALESALITHGFSYPANLEITKRMLDVIRNHSAVAAVIGVVDGKPKVGLSSDEIAELAADEKANKVSIRDLPLCPIRGNHGGTTVAATAWMAYQAGIKVFATGGIGGIHRSHPEDVSADLPILASTPIVVVCAGAKSILDIPRTLEYLETSGVPVVGWKTHEFPSFYSSSSGNPVDVCVDRVEEVAAIYRMQRELNLPQGLLVSVSIPDHASIPNEDIEPLIEQSVQEAEKRNISGKALTPYILAHMVALSESRTKYANESLLLNNTRVACLIARSLV